MDIINHIWHRVPTFWRKGTRSPRATANVVATQQEERGYRNMDALSWQRAAPEANSGGKRRSKHPSTLGKLRTACCTRCIRGSSQQKPVDRCSLNGRPESSIEERNEREMIDNMSARDGHEHECAGRSTRFMPGLWGRRKRARGQLH